MVEPLDECIITYESNGFDANTCFIPKYHLSDLATYDKNESARALDIFYHRIIPNWALACTFNVPQYIHTFYGLRYL